MIVLEQSFLDEVKKEASAIREYATNEQKSKLCIDTFYPELYDSCIYGQLTGDCFSSETIELMNKCNTYLAYKDVYTSSINEELRLAKPIKANTISRDRCYPFYTSLELYICLDGAKIEDLINYIKGEQKEFNL